MTSSASRLTIQDFLKKLLEVLNYPEMSDVILALNADDLTDDQRYRLDSIHRQLCVDRDPVQLGAHHNVTGEVSASEPRPAAATQAPKRKASPRVRPAHREAEMSRLSKNLVLEESLAEILKDEAVMADPKLIFGHTQLPLYEADTLMASDDVGGAFHACYEFILALNGQSSLNKLLWAMYMRFMHKLVTLINPKLSGRRLGPKTRVEFDEFLRHIFTNDAERELASKNANEWCLIGLKIDTLCAEFGSGCMFFLARHFSKDFFLNKYRESGKTNEVVFQELHALKFKEMVAESGASELCDSVDDFLIRGFQDHYRHRRH